MTEEGREEGRGRIRTPIVLRLGTIVKTQGFQSLSFPWEFSLIFIIRLYYISDKLEQIENRLKA